MKVYIINYLDTELNEVTNQVFTSKQRAEAAWKKLNDASGKWDSNVVFFFDHNGQQTE